MGRRHHSSASYNVTPQAALPPPAPAAQQPASPLSSLFSIFGPSKAPAETAAAQQPASPLNSLFSILAPSKTAAPAPFKLPPLPQIPTEELMGGISNMARGLVFNGNWWIVLLIIFLFFPNVSNKMFGGFLKE